MLSQSPESLVEERVAQLEAISLRRNELLRQMYHMMQRRRNFGAVLDAEDEDDDDLHVFMDKYDLQKSPQGDSFADVPKSELFVPPSPSEGHRSISPEDEAARPNEQSDIVPPANRPATPVEIAPPISRLSASLDGLANYSSSPPPQEPDETPMEVDEMPKEVPSLSPSLHDEPADESESDDILVTEPAEGQPSRTQSVSIPRQDVVDDDDDPDELDIIGSLTPSRSTSETSVEPYTQITTQEPSRADSEIVDIVSPEVSSRPLPSPDAAEHSDVDMAAEPDEKEIVAHEMLKEELDTMPSEREVTPELMHPEAESPVAISSPSSRIFQQPLIRSVAIEVPHRQTPLYMPAPSSPIPGLPEYDFDAKPEAEAETMSPHRPISPKQQRHHFNPIYNLPPLKALPVEFNRKPKPTKGQRRREKEREKNEKVSERGDPKRENKEDWVPMGINKWGATIRANPVYKRVSRASKCLSTREWNISWAELRLIRTLERIELMKDGGKWSLRQPKKQRGTGGLTKTHWDYLMDEMKWMRTDFREERKWKMALAYNLSTAVLEWHAAGSLEERVKRRISVLWKRPRNEQVDGDEIEKGDGFEQIDVDGNGDDQAIPNPMVDYNSSDNDDDEADPEQKDITDALDLSTALQEALEDVNATASGDRDQRESGEQEHHVEPKVEEREDLSALRSAGPNGPDDSMDVDGATQQESPPNGNGEDSVSKSEEDSGPSATPGLKPASSDPMLASISHLPSGDAEVLSNVKAAPKPNVYAPMRERIVYSDTNKLFIDLDDYDGLVRELAGLSTGDTIIEAPPPPPDLSAIFPDLQPFGLLNVPLVPTSVTSTDTKKKLDRKSDRDDPNKRVEDTSYTKLVPLGEFMHCKPTLIGALNPAKHWRQGKWFGHDDIANNIENDVSAANDTLCELFGGARPSSLTIERPREPKDARRRMADQLWTPNDDMLLKTLAERYPNNWPLIADAFNSSRVTISIDNRIPWDCYERWNIRWGAGSSLAKDAADLGSVATVDGATPPPAPPPRDQMTTRGIKRLASISVGANTSPGGSINEPKKRRRHNLMFDAIRKATKKREQNQKQNAAQKKSQAMHDTHGQYAKMPRYTPAELSRMKAERDMKEQEQLNFARRQQQELQRHQMLQQANRMPMAQQAQMLQQQQQQPNGLGRPSGAGLPAPQGVPQIRNQVNISQQQRPPATMGTGNTRLSPQQILQAQAAQARAIQVAAVQAQAAQNAAANMNGMGPSINNSHLSPPYNNRATTSSPLPHSSPPHPSTTLSNAASSPRPPSAQSQGNMGPAPQVPGNAMPRQAGNMGHYFPMVANMQNMQGMQNMQNVSTANFTQEQMEHALRLQSLVQSRQGMSQGQNSSYSSQT